jgi:nucleotide-binding universal stress UspA family protein
MRRLSTIKSSFFTPARRVKTEVIMSVRTILCLFRGTAQELNALSSAYALADAHLAQVRVLHVEEPAPMSAAALDATGFGFAAISDGDSLRVVDAAEKELTETARRHAAALAQRHHIAWREDDMPVRSSTVSATFRRRLGPIQACLSDEAKTCDLIVTGYKNTPDGDLTTVLTALFSADRPLLLVPHTPGAVMAVDGRPQTVLIGWDGSQAAAHATIAAVPILCMAQRVLLVTLLPENHTADRGADSDIEAYLHSHGITPEFVHLHRDKRKTGDVLLEQARTFGAELLVMGAYGHGHVAEMILGGVTDYILKHSRLPLLMTR